MAKSFWSFGKPFFVKKYVQIVHLAHQALHGFGRVFSVPEVQIKVVKITAFKMFRL